jgi:mono/diheme cytochrome c family protein
MTCHDRKFAPTQGASRTARWALPAIVATAALSAVLAAVWFQDAKAADRQLVERGKYLVTVANCTDCHTPGHFFGKPDLKRELGGSEVGFEIPGLGIFHGPNLTPDQATGLGSWSEADIVTAIQTGRRPDARELAPIMPWQAFAKLTKSDAQAIAAYLKSLPPVRNKVPGPFGPSETPTAFVMKIVAPPQR